MNVPLPRPLKIDRAALLRDVRARLADRLPAYAVGEPDPTDPGWLLLGEAAWMVELLTEQLDRAPLSALQHLIHLMGGHLLPATPALAAVVCGVAASGKLTQNPDLPDQTRFFSRSDERAGPLEFVPVEPELWLHDARLGPLATLRAGNLYSCGRPWTVEGFGELGAAVGPAERASLFDEERGLFTVAAANPEQVAAAMGAAVAEIEKLRLGWLRLEILPITGERVTLAARVDLALPFRRAIEAGIWPGGDLEGDWRPLPTLAWTPGATIAPDPRLPPEHHHAAPTLLASGEGFLIPDVPEGFPLHQILNRSPSPTPRPALEAIWQLVAHANADLLAFKPIIARAFGQGAERDTATWVRAALGSGQWAQIARRGERTVAPVLLAQPVESASLLRVGVLLPALREREPVEVEAWTWGAEGKLARKELAPSCAWRLAGSGGLGAGGGVAGYDVPLAPGDRGVLFGVSGALSGICLNVALAANTPAVRDGRLWTVQRNVPEPVSLLFQDLVTSEVVSHTLEQPVPPETAARLAALPLAHFSVEDLDGAKGIIRDLRGVAVDPTEGRLTLNAPDGRGEERTLRAGSRVRLDWYRRTDGAVGRVGAGTISQVSQAQGTNPVIKRVYNPLGAELGADRERSEDAVDRLFGPGDAVPTLPSDFERLARQALAPRADGWLVRCWTYAERTLMQHAMWPLSRDLQSPPDPELLALRAELASAGPDQVLFAIAAPEAELSDDDLAWARARLDNRIHRLRDRLPSVRGAVVCRSWALTLSTPANVDPPDVLPAFSTDQWRGTLRDSRGRSAPCPANTLLLNAAIVAVTRPA